MYIRAAQSYTRMWHSTRLLSHVGNEYDLCAHKIDKLSSPFVESLEFLAAILCSN